MSKMPVLVFFFFFFFRNFCVSSDFPFSTIKLNIEKKYGQKYEGKKPLKIPKIEKAENFDFSVCNFIYVNLFKFWLILFNSRTLY